LKVKSKSVRSGFTLIELLIVIVIVGILAGMAIASFGSTQKHARMEVAVDSIISLIKEQKGKAQNGRQFVSTTQPSSPGQTQSFCYGIVFQKVKTPYIQTIVAPYFAVSPNKEPKADYCDPTSTQTELTPLVVSDDLVLDGIQQGSAPQENLVILFKPPFGAVIEVPDLSVDTSGKTAPTTDENPVQILLNQKNNAPSDERIIQFDALSGLVQKVNAPSSPNP